MFWHLSHSAVHFPAPPSPLLDYELFKGRDAVPQGLALGQDIAGP